MSVYHFFYLTQRHVCGRLVVVGSINSRTGGGPWPRGPPRAPAPLSRGTKQGCDPHTLACEAHGCGVRRLVEPGWSNRRGRVARRYVSRTAWEEERRTLRGNPRSAHGLQKGRGAVTSGTHRWQDRRDVGPPPWRSVGLKTTRLDLLGAMLSVPRTTPRIAGNFLYFCMPLLVVCFFIKK